MSEFRVIEAATLQVRSNALPSRQAAEDFVAARWPRAKRFAFMEITDSVALVWRDGKGNEVPPEKVDLLSDVRLYVDLRDTLERAH